jgi:hypothetical protein
VAGHAVLAHDPARRLALARREPHVDERLVPVRLDLLDGRGERARGARRSERHVLGPHARHRALACRRDAEPARRHEVHRRAPDEAGHEAVGRLLVELGGPRHLLEAPALEHRDAVAERERLDLVVRHVEHGGGRAPAQLRDLGAHLHPQLGVEVRERLVEQEGCGLAHQRAAHRDALPLAARELARRALEQRREREQLRHARDALRALSRGHAAHLQREGQVLAHREVRVERVVLEHHRDVALLRRERAHVPAADADRAARRRLEAGQQAQHGGLAAARGPHQCHQLAVRDLEREVAERDDAARVDLLHALERDRRHGPSLLEEVLVRQDGQRALRDRIGREQLLDQPVLQVVREREEQHALVER